MLHVVCKDRLGRTKSVRGKKKVCIVMRACWRGSDDACVFWQYARAVLYVVHPYKPCFY